MGYITAKIWAAGMLLSQARNPGAPEASVLRPAALFLGLTDSQIKLIHDKNLEFN
jgi:hypothetical protein